ncbi:AMP-binding protein [Agromyces seonyuensis]|uniref:AMP-binding protein n=1 Tax=Agromyces seonyuensis TaxID=2662446 RepID=A0A6I4NVE5_9MICO|nr:AMP-binding protein [Agromyces seonyuensis]MWB98081.1 AMP-binding protein [Agromyces seonyuensis]
MKPLIRVPGQDVPALRAALAAALDGGPAVFPLAAADQAVAGVPDQVDERIALVVETSGSTARPKRVALAADALIAGAEASAAALEGHGRWLLALPGHYIAGAQVLVRSIVAGHEPEVLPDGPFTAEAFAHATMRIMRTRDARPRYTSLVPVQLARLVEAAAGDPDHDAARALGAYAAVLVGGQALPADTAERTAALGARIVRTYGSSETAGGCVYDGRSLPGVRVRVTDGQVELGGPALAAGYLDDPARTAAAFHEDAEGRWYRTGDLGMLGETGILRVTGRADDVIISGGVKVVLGEVERAVRAAAGFADAVVVRVADPVWGERPAVLAAAVDGRTDEASALATLAAAIDAAGLPTAARPTRIAFAASIPLLSSGKPDRRAAAALFA